MEMEESIGFIFSEGHSTPDYQAQEELIYYIKTIDNGHGIPEDKIIREARRLIPIYAVNRTVEMLEKAGIITAIGFNAKTKMRTFKFNDSEP